MEIKTLASTDMETIIGCLSHSFADYFVPMSFDIDYWQSRFRVARISLHHSYGYFDKEKLCGFILTGIDRHEDYLTAYNGGTGVIPEYRGHHIVDQLYDHAIPVFKKEGIERCTLEVIDQNERAIRVYERIGFQKTKKLHCFKGIITGKSIGTEIRETDLTILNNADLQNEQFPSWDHTWNGIQAAGGVYSVFEVLNAEKIKIGFFVINLSNGYIPQIGMLTTHASTEDWRNIVSSVSSVSKTVKANNIDSRRNGLLDALEYNGLENFIDQFEMQLFL